MEYHPPVNLYDYVASQIRDLRSRFGGDGLSQEALAKKLGVATNTISRWETGAYKPKLSDLDDLARFFGVSILEFFPKEQDLQREPINALLRATRDMPDEDIIEVQRYADYRRARHMLENGPGDSSTGRGRPRKDAE